MIYVQVKNSSVVNRAEFDNVVPADWPEHDTWHRSDVAQIGWLFDGNEFIAPPVDPVPPSRRSIPKSVVLSRLTDEQFDAVFALLTQRQKERWRSPDVPNVYADDEEVIGLLTAAGADPNVILA